jgi:predicted anti-sigma-YlaC factor YlaD
MTCNDTTLSLGVYLLGALDPDERAAVERHLTTCQLCRAELAELAGLPAMLERLTLDDLTPEPVPPSDDLFERVAAQARAETDPAATRPLALRYRRLLAVAAALVLVAGVGIGSWAALRPSSDTHISAGHVRMQVTLASQATGTTLAVSVSGLPTDEHCRLIAVAKDGTRDVAGNWDATYGGRANVTGSTSIPRSQLVRLVLLGTNGQHLATVPV